MSCDNTVAGVNANWSLIYSDNNIALLQQEENRDLIDRWMAQKAKDAEKLNLENDSILKLVANFLSIIKVSLALLMCAWQYDP